MPSSEDSEIQTPTSKVEDSIAKVDGELAVGEDIVFQRKWWTFEKWVWRFFALIVLADLLGAFGRGPLANASKTTPDKAMDVHYERIERFSTPSVVTIHLGPQAVHNGNIYLFVSNSMVHRLGNQRVIPQPSTSETVQGGIVYTFPSEPQPSTVAFALQPADIWMSHFTVKLLNDNKNPAQPQDSLTLGVFVMP